MSFGRSRNPDGNQSVQEGDRGLSEEKKLIFWHRFFIAVLIVLLIPLAVISFYNHPSADDFASALHPHLALQESGGASWHFLADA